jgi:hypothetical protein
VARLAALRERLSDPAAVDGADSKDLAAIHKAMPAAKGTVSRNQQRLKVPQE